MDILLDKYRSTEYDKVYIFYARKIIKTRFIAKVCHKNLQSKSSQEEQVVYTVSLNCCRECFFAKRAKNARMTQIFPRAL